MSELIYSSYGVLKNVGERITKDLGGIIVRFWNVYGYEGDGEKSHVITDFIKMAKYDGVIKMRTDGLESRQFLYGDDCAEALLVISKQYDTLDKTKNYHITNFQWTTILEIAAAIQNISGCLIEIGDRKDQTQKNAMNEPDNYILGLWQPTVTLEEGINKLYKLF
jgi:nucleoside-diphosphate-sugar epimerase